jgi:PAS domain S-box-containing protein
MSDELHSLLHRQLKRFFGASPEIPSEWMPLLRAVDAAYREFDSDRRMLERSLELSSQELLHANTEMRAIFQAIPDLFFRIDVDGTILDYKAGTGDDYFTDPKTLLGKRFQEVPFEEVRAKLDDAISRLRRERTTVTLEYALPVRGAERFYEARFIPLPETQAIVMIRNITERKRIEAQLLLSDRMAALGTLAAGVAHEINNPLTYVVTNLSYALKEAKRALDRDPSGFDGLVESLEQAREGAQRVRQIVRDLRAFSHTDAEQRDALDVRRVLDSAINMALTEIKHRAQLIKSYREVPNVSANEGRLAQVFLNLLVNAAQAIPEGSVSANRIEVSTDTVNGKVVVEIRDTGGGISSRDMPRIFEPFFTTKPVGIGTGLGLFICQTIVSALDGEITVDSREGTGTTARVTLPAIGAAQPVAREEARSAGPRSRILVIDDEEKIGAAIARALEHEHDIESTTSPARALERLAGGEEFDLILCDVLMPEMSGMELFTRLCEVAPAQASRVVFVTAGARSPTVRAFLDGMTNRYLEKPVDLARIEALIREMRSPK